MITDQTSVLHALTAGAIGTMTLIIMTRTTLGHTGHLLVADRGIVLIYCAITLAAVLRIGASLAGEYYFDVLAAATLL